MEHPSEKDRERYLKEHPKADPSNHVVKDHPDKAKPEGEHPDKTRAKPEEDEHGEHAPKKNVFKSVSEKAKAFLKGAPAAVQKFVADGDHRKRVLSDAGKAVMGSPRSYAKNLVHVAKEEVHEFKEAGGAVKSLIQGKKLDKHQKKAIRTVAVHMGITLAAAALSSTSIFAGAAFVGKAMAKKIAMKGVAKAMENVHVLGELGHVGHHAIHGISELMEKFAADEQDDEGVSPEEALAALVMKYVVEALDQLSDDDVIEAVNEGSEEEKGEKQKLAWKSHQATATTFPDLLEDILQKMKELQTILNNFDRTLVTARHESEDLADADKRVWQTRFVNYFRDMDSAMDRLQEIRQSLDDIYLDDKKLSDLALQARSALIRPRKSETDYAIADIEFGVHPATGQEEITYSIARLKEWDKALQAWVKSVNATVTGLIKKAKAKA